MKKRLYVSKRRVLNRILVIKIENHLNYAGAHIQVQLCCQMQCIQTSEQVCIITKPMKYNNAGGFIEKIIFYAHENLRNMLVIFH
jgi:hypothetical protein